MGTIKLIDTTNNSVIKTYSFDSSNARKVTTYALDFALKLEHDQFANRQCFGWVRVETLEN